MIPAEAPIPSRPRRVGSVSADVGVRVGVRLPNPWLWGSPCSWSWEWSCAAPPARAARQRERSRPIPTRDDQEPGREAEPGIEVLRRDPLRPGPSATSPRANTPIVWVTVTIPPRAMASRGRPLRPDEVGGDHRLAVARLERVQGSPAQRREQEQQEHALARGGILEQALEAPALPVGGLAAPRVLERDRLAVGPGDRAVPGLDRQRDVAVHRRVGRVDPLVVGEPVRRVGCALARLHRRPLAGGAAEPDEAGGVGERPVLDPHLARLGDRPPPASARSG